MPLLSSFDSGIRAWLSRLSTAWTVAILGGVTIAAVVGGVFTYQMYDYVQHDNDFCLSCHLMVNPYELFGESAHRGLGCKACHQPTLIQRSTMGLTQILENPDSLSAHAHVPNERCVSCHVEGDEDQWLQIANSAGHRIHFESEEPILEGLQCVECHSSSLHQFTAAQETCGQSECHTDAKITLGKMADLTIHCAACHGFSSVAPSLASEEGDASNTTALRGVLAPDAETCLSCHAMRVLMDLPEEDPHQGMCASCHNPHTQTSPSQAVETCTTSGCHEDPMSVTPMHRGMAPGIMEGCLACHSAHDFRPPGNECVDCHQDIFEPGGPSNGIALSPAPAAAGATPGVLPDDAIHAGTGSLALVPGPSGIVHASLGSAVVSSALAAEAGGSMSAVHAAPQQAPQENPWGTARFTHAPHRNVNCLNCHSSEPGHGALTITGINDCRACHHSNPLPVSNGCTACHGGVEHPEAPYQVTRTLSLSVSQPKSRDLPFDHEKHEGQACATCHVAGPQLSAAEVDCNSCHEEHHEVGNACRSCHVLAPAPAHSVQVHLGCAAAGCHEVLPFGGGVPRQREFCMTCHQDKVDHRPAEPDCSQCHQLPQPGPDAQVREDAEG